MPETTEIPQAQCNACGCDIDAGTVQVCARGDDWCMSCFDESFAYCDGCGCECVRGSDDLITQNNSAFCGDCYRANFVDCMCCGGTASIEDCTSAPNGDLYCQGCIEVECTECDGCDRLCWTCDTSSSGDCRYCGNCASHDEWDHEGYYDSNATYALVGSERKYGIEFETHRCPDHINLKGETVFGCKEDGSVDGMEFVSPVLFGDGGFVEVDKLCRFARQNNWEVNSSCGLHLHCDMSAETDEVLLKVALAYQYTYDFWTSFITDARKSNYYCAPNDWDHADVLAYTNFREFLGQFGMERYRWFNVAAYSDHKTFEIRFHSATLNASKTKNWVKAHLRFIDGVKGMTLTEITDAFAGTDTGAQFDAIAKLWDDDDLAAFYAERAESFGKPLKSEALLQVAI